jgi:hypothetical protein
VASKELMNIERAIEGIYRGCDVLDAVYARVFALALPLGIFDDKRSWTF